MKLIRTQLAIALLGCAAAGAALAQDDKPEGGPPPGPPPGHRPPPPPAVIVVLDTDKDGELSAEEIANAVEALKTLDKDGDGKLSHEEMCPPPPEKGGKGKRPQKNSDKSATGG